MLQYCRRARVIPEICDRVPYFRIEEFGRIGVDIVVVEVFNIVANFLARRLQTKLPVGSSDGLGAIQEILIDRDAI